VPKSWKQKDIGKPGRSGSQSGSGKNQGWIYEKKREGGLGEDLGGQQCRGRATTEGLED